MVRPDGVAQNSGGVSGLRDSQGLAVWTAGPPWSTSEEVGDQEEIRHTLAAVRTMMSRKLANRAGLVDVCLRTCRRNPKVAVRIMFVLLVSG